MVVERYDFSRVSILVADGNRFMRQTISHLLRAFGFKLIIECDDGADAFEQMRAQAVDIIICDAIMDPLDGLDFTRLVRQAPDCKAHEVPVILLTGHSEHFRVLQARDLGANEFLVKPVSADTLWRRLVHVVEEPRAFVRSRRFTGPDRRRHREDDFEGVDKRAGAAVGTLSQEEVAALLGNDNDETTEMTAAGAAG